MSEIIPFSKKLVDIGKIPVNGQIDNYWEDKIIENVFNSIRKSKERKNVNFRYFDAEYLLKTFNLSGFEFGNWLSQEDRYIYMAGCAFAIKDFCDIHNIPYKKFGFNDLSIAFGARGKGGRSTLAHFEPVSNIINLTRHRTLESINQSRYAFGARPLSSEYYEKNKYFLSNGAGSLGHEYGHAIDFKIGRLAPNLPYNFATESINLIKYNHVDKKGVKHYVKKNDFKIDNSVRPFYNVMKSLMYVSKGNNEFILTPFLTKLERKIKDSDKLGDYWIEIVEVFARSFEVYLKMKCDEKGIKESYLKKTKYESILYPTTDFMLKSGAYKNFEKLMRSAFKLRSINPQKSIKF